jgi:competence protein ComGC
MRSVIRLRVLGFSLAELFVVGIVLMVIGANTIPRFSRGAESLAEAALSGNLAVLRNGLDVYASDHGGQFPSVGNFDAQMTQYTDDQGNASANQDSVHRHGPYLRRVPVLPVGPMGWKGSAIVLDASGNVPGKTAAAWVYNPKTGEVRANLADDSIDYSGKRYNRY